MADNFPDLILNDGSKPLDPKSNDYFLVTITDLKPGKTYPIEFRWNYSDKTKKADWGAVLKVQTPSYAPDAVTNVNASWVKEIFTLTFTHDRTLGQNSNVSYYKIKLIAPDSTAAVFRHEPQAGSNQKFTKEYSEIVGAFGVPVSQFSGSIIAVDKDNNESVAVTFPLTSATTDLPVATISAAGSSLGYTVSYTTPDANSYPNYNKIVIEEIISDSPTDPGTGYEVVYSGSENPAAVPRSIGGNRWIRARFYSKLGLPGPYGAAVTATPTPAVVVNTNAPAAPTPSGSPTAGIDPNGAIGFNGYINLSWNAVNDSTLRGYRIRFRVNGSNDPYSYADSPGTGTTYRLQGLAVGTTYEIGIASYNIINNVSNAGYNTFTATTIGGTPFIGTNVNTTGYFSAGTAPNDFQFGYGIDPSNNSGTFSGTKRGLYFTSSNYWVIDSSQTAKFKLGGSTSNYVQWQDNILTVDGNITAKGGKFTGNVQLDGGSLYAGSSPTSGTRMAINQNGITAYNGNTDTTNIYAVPQTLGSGANQVVATFKTTGALIADWVIRDNVIEKTVDNGKITLDAANARITASGTTIDYVAGIAAPRANSPSDIVFYAGSSTPSSAPFRVTAGGSVTMTSATITGFATTSQLSAVETTANNASSTASTASTNANSAITIANGKNKTFYQASQPTASATGDIWFDTDDGYKAYRWSGSQWETARDSGIQAAATAAANAQTEAESRLKSSTNVIANSSNEITSINTGGVTVYSGASSSSGARVIMNSAGIAGYNSNGDPTFSVSASTGAAIFKGDITGASGTFTGTLSGNTISGASIVGGDISISSDTTSDRIKTSYSRTGPVDSTAVTSFAVNAIAHVSTTTSGWVTSTYPYWNGGADLGTSNYRWRRLLLNNGNYGTTSDSYLDLGNNTTRLLSDGRIYANTLGTASTSNFITQSSGYLRVNTSSSLRYKENVVDINTDPAMNTNALLNVPIKLFKYKSNYLSEEDQRSGKMIPGFIAEDLAEIYPIAVDYNDEGMPERWNANIMVPALLDLIKKQNQELINIKQRLDALEG